MNDRRLLKLIIILYPVLDILFSFTSQILHINVPVNQAIRVLILLYLFFRFTTIKDKIYLLLLLSLFGIAEIFYIVNGHTSLVTDAQYISKIMFFVIVMFSFKYILFKNIFTVQDIFDYSIISSYFITISIVLSLFGIGFNTYIDGTGYKGLFIAQNAVTATLLIMAPLNIYMLSKTQKKRYLISFFLAIFSLCVLGTKAGIVGALLISTVILIVYLIRSRITHVRLAVSFMTIATIALFCFLERETIVQAYQATILRINSWGNSNVYSFIVSNRDLHIQWVKDYILMNYNYNPLWFFGIGYTTANNVIIANQYDIIEMDFQGLLYYSGIWITIIISLIIVKRIFYAIKNLIISRFSINNIALFISIAAGTAHSYFGGHVIYEALSSFYYGIVLTSAYVINVEQRKK